MQGIIEIRERKIEKLVYVVNTWHQIGWQVYTSDFVGRNFARTEGILLDTTYTGKTMAALIDDVRKGAYTRDQAIVFVHTGGTPALFAYRDELVEMLPETAGPASVPPLS